MKLQQILDVIQRTGDTLDRIRSTIDSRLYLESTESKRRVSWDMEPRKQIAHLRFRSEDQEAAVRVVSGDRSAVEFWEQEGKRGVTLRAPESISWEMDAERLEHLNNAKAAGIACAAGATLGFLAWLALVAAGKLMEPSQEELPPPEDR